MLSETKRVNKMEVSTDHVFVYEYEHIFTYEERKNDLTSDRVLKSMVAKAVNSRLRVRSIPDLLATDGGESTRYVAFFIDDSEPLPMDLSSAKLNEMSKAIVG